MITYKTIVFIHGLHENARCWQAWISFFEELGFICHAPNYPYHDGTPHELRANPIKELSTVSLRNVVEHYAKFINDLGCDRPILIGHSMGGLIVQQLIAADMGSVGVCITSASPKGVFSFRWSYIKSNIGIVNPFKGNTIYCGSKEWFHYAICNTLSRQESDTIYEKAIVPESRNIPRSSRLREGTINFEKPHKPLLFIGAEQDRIIPITLNLKNVRAYKDKESVTDFKEFKGRSHYILAQEGWEEVAIFVEDWLLKYLK